MHGADASFVKNGFACAELKKPVRKETKTEGQMMQEVYIDKEMKSIKRCVRTKLKGENLDNFKITAF
jgi:hypothetical protein